MPLRLQLMSLLIRIFQRSDVMNVLTRENVLKMASSSKGRPTECVRLERGRSREAPWIIRDIAEKT